MTFTAIIETHRLALLRMVAMVFRASGLGAGKPAMLSKIVRGSVLFWLRPMEAAGRRLVVAEADRVRKDGYVPPERKAPSKPIPRGGRSRGHVFALFDRRIRVGPARLVYAKTGPRILFFDGSDRVVEAAAKDTPADPDAPRDATQLLHRLEALKAALEDLPKQARRLVRMQARREKAGKRPIRPVRPGRPPGHRSGGTHEVDEVLRECHQLALMALAAPDTG